MVACPLLGFVFGFCTGSPENSFGVRGLALEGLGFDSDMGVWGFRVYRPQEFEGQLAHFGWGATYGGA